MRRLLAALALAAGAGLLLGGQGLAKPKATLTRFEVETLSLRDVTFLFELSVQNPYPLGLSFSGMNLDFFVEGTRVFSATSQGGFSVPARSSKAQTFTVTLAYDAIAKTVKDYIEKDYLHTTIDGSLLIPLPKLPGLPKDLSFSYHLEKKIPAIKPSVALLDFRVSPPSKEQVAAAVAKAGKTIDTDKARSLITQVLAGSPPKEQSFDPADLDLPLQVSFTIQVANEAKAPLGFTALDYELFVYGQALVAGRSGELRQEGTKTLITVVNTFSSKQLTKEVRRLFVDKGGDFAVKGSASIKLPDEIRKDPLPLAFIEQGRFSLR